MYASFEKDWELDFESKLGLKWGLEYRAWNANSPNPKGFVSRALNKVVNEYRKKIYWVRRRNTTSQGKRCKKYDVVFDPAIHIVGFGKDKAKQPKKRAKYRYEKFVCLIRFFLQPYKNCLTMFFIVDVYLVTVLVCCLVINIWYDIR
jgi:hypothetical protein